MMEFDWGGLIVSIISVALTGFLIPYLKKRMSKEQLTTVSEWVKIAVLAAEQLFGAGEGKAKLAYVQTYLADLGIKINTEALRGMIEAAVYELSAAQGKHNAIDTKEKN